MSKAEQEIKNSSNIQPTPSKKKSWWIWVLISCLGFLLISGLLIGGCVYYSAKKGGGIINQNNQLNQFDSLMKEGNQALYDHDFKLARDKFSAALEIKPEDDQALLGRAKGFLFDLTDFESFLSQAKQDIESSLKKNEASSEAHVIRARIYLNDHSNYVEGEKEVRRAIELDDKSAKAHVYLGYILLKQGKEKKSIEELNKALSYDKNDEWVRSIRGQCFRSKSKPDYAAAEAEFKKATELNPNYEYGFLFLGEVYYLEKKGNEGKAAYDKALSLKEKFPTALVYWGDYYREKEDYVKAKEYYDKAMAIDSTSSDVNNAMGNYYGSSLKPDYKEAYNFYTKAINFGSTYDWVIYNNRAYTDWYMLETDKQIADFLKAKEIDPNKNQASYDDNLAQAFISQKKYSEADKYAREALKKNPKMVFSLIVLADTCIDWEGHVDYKKAHEYLDQAFAIKETQYGYSVRGYLYSVEKNWDKSISDLTKAIEWKGVSDYYKSDNYANRCNSYIGKKDLDKATADCNAALKIDPKLYTAWYNMGAIAEIKGDKAKAREYYQKALEINPEYKKAKGGLERVK